MEGDRREERRTGKERIGKEIRTGENREGGEDKGEERRIQPISQGSQPDVGWMV